MIRTALLLLVLAGLAQPADPPAELKPFQGVWVVQAATLAGRDHLEDFKTMKLTVAGDKYEATVNALKDTGTITVDPSKSPKWLTLRSAEKNGPFEGRAMPGLYEFEGETLKVCLNAETDDRPTKFEAPDKTRLMLIVFEREKKK